jgi:outer membrane protein OmpA-like peptidoglycan-associated protein
MRHWLGVALQVSLGACALFEPSQRRFVVFFQESSWQLTEPAEGVLSAAADWARKHPDMPVIVASYADPYGSQQVNIDITRLRTRATVDALVADGVLATRIERQEIGTVKFEIDSQESRRVDVVVGNR